MKTTIEEIQARDNRTYHGNWASQSEKDRATLLPILAEVGELPEKWESEELEARTDTPDDPYAMDGDDCAIELRATLNTTNQQGGD